LDFDSQKGSFVSGSGRLCQISLKSVQNCDRESTDRHIHILTHTHIHRDHTSDLIICPMLCYSYGTDNNNVMTGSNEAGSGLVRATWRLAVFRDERQARHQCGTGIPDSRSQRSGVRSDRQLSVLREHGPTGPRQSVAATEYCDCVFCQIEAPLLLNLLQN